MASPTRFSTMIGPIFSIGPSGSIQRSGRIAVPATAYNSEIANAA